MNALIITAIQLLDIALKVPTGQSAVSLSASAIEDFENLLHSEELGR